MKTSFGLRPKIGLALIVALASVLAGAFDERAGLSASRLDDPSRLIAIEPWVEMDSAACEWTPPAAISRRDMVAARQQQATAAVRPSESARAAVAARKPVRMIHDPNALFSAVAVDAARNEVILQDENLFRVLVYDRTANTPANAQMTEPKRIIGGPQTHLELNSAVYVDPKTGEIYAVNNDMEDHVTVFGRDKRGDVPPTRKVHTPHGAFGIAVDEETQEMFLTIQHMNAVSIVPKTAEGEDPPTGVIQGDRTLIADPHGIAIDSNRDLLFVSNFGSTATPSSGGRVFYDRTGKQTYKNKPHWPKDPGQMVPGSGRNLPASITVYPKSARGDVAPIRVIQGPKTQLNWPAGMAVDPGRGELYVANDGGDSVLVFSVMAEGDAAPIRVLKGPRTQLKYPSGVFVDLVNDELWVANFGNHKATAYKRDASGDTAPVRVIRSAPENVPAPALANPHPVAFDTKRGEILAPN
jgi:DNA-binding beta-propeller fold protein YncE